MNWFSALILFLLLPSIALAGEPVTYSPDYCEFSITFPGEPYTTQRCEDGNQDRCYDLVSYTQVYMLSSTVKFRVICNPTGEDIYRHYSGEVMETTVKAMTERSVVKTFDTSFREEENYKQAGLVGEGKAGMTPTIFIAQLWLGHGSIFSVEAELTGEKHEDADALFSEVLKSVRFVEEEEENSEEQTEEN